MIRPRRFQRILAVLSRRQPDLTVLMDRVHKPHNLSAVARSCDAVGVGTIHAIPIGAGLKLHRPTSAGTSRWVEVRSHPDLPAGLEWMDHAGFQVVVAHLSNEAIDFREVDYTRPTAILVGSEKTGVDETALAEGLLTVQLPMLGMVQSLNVSVATALLLYEAQRQRQSAGLYAKRRLPPEEHARLLFEWSYPRLALTYREEGRPYPTLAPDGSIEGAPP